MKSLQSAVCAGLVLLLSACAHAGGESVTSDAAPAADPAAGKTILEAQCSACHELAVATAPRPAADWRPTLDRMVSYGSAVTEDELKLLEAYMIANYSAG